MSKIDSLTQSEEQGTNAEVEKYLLSLKPIVLNEESCKGEEYTLQESVNIKNAAFLRTIKNADELKDALGFTRKTTKITKTTSLNSSKVIV